MSRILRHYPATGDPLVRGDPLSIPVTFSFDITGWTWIAQVRARPDDDPAIDFTITPDGTDPAHKLTLSLTSAQTAQLDGGEGWDLQSVTPTVETWILCQSLRVQKDYSRS